MNLGTDVLNENEFDRDDELKNMKEEDVKWLSAWKIRASSANGITKSILNKIQCADDNFIVENITLPINKVYITKLTYQKGYKEKTYNVAIYNMSKNKKLSGLRKMTINSLDELESERIKRYVYIDKCENYDYWLLSFVESSGENNITPSLVIQVSGSNNDEDISNLLELLGIMCPIDEKDMTTELRDICFSFNNKENISFSNKIRIKKDQIIKLKEDDNRHKLCFYDDALKAEENGIYGAIYSCNGGVRAKNWVNYFMKSDIKECPHIVKLDDDNDYILEIVRAIRFARQKRQIFKRNFETEIIKKGEITLPNGKQINDITLSINTKEASFVVSDSVYKSIEKTEWLGKNNVILGFGKRYNDKYPIEISCNWDCVDDLMNYIMKDKYNPDEIVIYVNRINTGENSTVGTLITNDETICGYTVELPRGTDEECKSICEDSGKLFDCHCIMEGIYDFEINTKIYPNSSWAEDYTNNTLRITSRVENGREGILVHKGCEDAKRWSKGCILPMPYEPLYNCKYASNDRKNTLLASRMFTISIVEWVTQKEMEIKKRNPFIKNVSKKIIITKSF